MCQVDILDLFHKMEEKGLFLCSVESLTGGLFASTITEIPGASHIYKGSFVTYCNEIKNIIGDVKITFISHEELKGKLKECKAVVRTGEQTPYANIILKSGVVF